MRDLTQRQREILDFIAQFNDDNGFAPTVREICNHFDISIRAVQDHVSALQKKNALIVTKHKSRSMKVMEEFKTRKDKPSVSEIPVIKSGAAEDLLDPSNVSGVIYRSASFIQSNRTYFATHASDNAMKNLGILEGDLLVAEKTEVFPDGFIVLASYGNKILVRRLTHQDSKPCLVAEDSRFPNISKHFKVIGLLVEISRKF